MIRHERRLNRVLKAGHVVILSVMTDKQTNDVTLYLGRLAVSETMNRTCYYSIHVDLHVVLNLFRMNTSVRVHSMCIVFADVSVCA